MALLTIGAYAAPAPTVDTYSVECVPVIRAQVNTQGITLGEFVRYRRTIRWGYAELSAANNAALANALKINTGGTALAPVSVTYWDPDSNSFQTGTFLAGPTSPRWSRLDGTPIYSNVAFELAEM